MHLQGFLYYKIIINFKKYLVILKQIVYNIIYHYRKGMDKMVYFWLIMGFVLLVKGADLFVDGSASLAKKFNIPPVIIGLTVVAFGTSAPEAAVSISAAMKGSNDIAIANIIGSNIFNLLAVTGISALIAPMAVKVSILKGEFPLSIVITAILLVMCVSGGAITRVEGIILLIIFAGFLYSMIHKAIKTDEEAEGEIKEMGAARCAAYIAAGLTGIIIGGNTVVDSAKEIALRFGMSDMLVGLTIVSIGTSLPELVTSIVAGVKGQSDIALGNVVGSNIFNIIFVLGMSAAVMPITAGSEAIIDTAILIAISIVVYIMAFSAKKINRAEGAIMAAAYAGYMEYIIIR